MTKNKNLSKLKNFTNQEIFAEAEKRKAVNSQAIETLLVELANRIKTGDIENNWMESGDGCRGTAGEDDCSCSGTETLSYRDDNWDYSVDLEHGIFEKTPRGKN